MASSTAVSQNTMQNCLNSIQQRVESVKNQIYGFCSTDNKVYIFLILGRALQAAALVSLVASIAFTFTIGSIALAGTVPAIALGILGTYVVGNPERISDLLQIGSPFVIGQPVGLVNSGNNCWLNSSLQILVNCPSFHRRMRQIPEFRQFLDDYAAARRDHQKVASIDIPLLRQFLSHETGGQIAAAYTQSDAAQFFEYLFRGPYAVYELLQRMDGGVPIIRREPMIQIDLGGGSPLNFQQLFNSYFDYRSNTGQHFELFFPRSPDDLLIQAKRFYQRMNPTTGLLEQGKIIDPIDAPESFTLPSRFVRTGESPEYMCDAFSIHNGVSQDGGHYTCYIKVENKWWYCSDASVVEVSTQDALNAMRDGYIFHYSKRQS